MASQILDVNVVEITARISQRAKMSLRLGIFCLITCTPQVPASVHLALCGACQGLDASQPPFQLPCNMPHRAGPWHHGEGLGRIRETHHEIDQKQALLRSFAWPNIVSVGLYDP
jgi:hypothetical protein